MIFQQILMQIFHKLNQERTISAPFHLLRGKRSGQTIQDVGIYQLHHFFGILPKLSRKKYDEEISLLIEKQFIRTDEAGSYELMNNHIEDIGNLPFDGWHYRGNEHVFFARLSLIIQSLSHKKAGQMSFIPIQKDEVIQQWVKNFLLINNFQEGTIHEQLMAEMIHSLENTHIEEKVKSIIINRLAGYEVAGFTWQQLSFIEKVSEMDIQLLYIAGLHSWLNSITSQAEQYPLLNNVAQNVRINIPLTGSAFQSTQLFLQGYSIEQISKIRGLKISTIEDHIVELAMNEPHFSIEQFISGRDVQLVLNAIEDYNTKKLKVLHEVLPHLTYFQLRLVLARGDL
ncbi:helix-turn-helix domain-containing protein [Lysinibacillus telephonicus]|uniref:Recombinase RecQ n=2 Tax=Lysinibacillus telephonicus TaxID=1714840 RepID=A0A3S0HZ15_9BACI|nr:recombinase RecQ [Lysinibacillus telephonicus]